MNRIDEMVDKYLNEATIKQGDEVYPTKGVHAFALHKVVSVNGNGTLTLKAETNVGETDKYGHRDNIFDPKDVVKVRISNKKFTELVKKNDGKALTLDMRKAK